MPAGFVDLWASGSIPWVEIILVLVVVNVLLLSGGGSKKGLLRWLSKTATSKPKKGRAPKAKTPTARVSSKRKRSSENKGWDLAEVNGAGLQGANPGGVSSKRKRLSNNKGWVSSGPDATPAFKVNSRRKRSSNREGWSASEISEAKSSFSVSELRNRSSKRLDKELSHEEVSANGAKKSVKPSRPPVKAQAAPRVGNAGIKSAPSGSVSLNSPLRKKGSPIRIGGHSRTR